MLWKKAAAQPLSNLRIFISSTFRDMAAERDVLARRIFPRLRQYSEAHGLPLSEIDLRWGITSEEAAEGKVIELCLQEIDACRPYFFSMLGERYGWIDPRAAERLTECFPHLLPFADRSVTELEIRHGALGPPIPNGRCFFYLRAAGYLDHLPPGSDRADFADDNQLHRERLAALKREIKASGFPVREYADLDTFRDLFERDLRDAIAPAVDATRVDRNEVGERGFVTSVSQAYIEQAATRTFLSAARGRRTPVVLTGGPGSGKSAALAHWLDTPSATEPRSPPLWRQLVRLRARASRPPAILCRILQIDADADDWLPVAQNLLADLKTLIGRPEAIARTPEGVIKQLRAWLASAASVQPVLLIVDGIERAYRRPGQPMLDWLPTPLPRDVGVILSAREGALSKAMADRNWACHALAGFSPNDIRTVVRDYLALYGKRLAGELLDIIAAAPQASTPLFARTLADELRQFGIHEQLRHYLAEYLACPDVTTLFARVLRRLDQDYRFDHHQTAGDALELIAASRGGLAESEILDLLGRPGVPMSARPWSELRLAIKNHLIERQGLIDIGPSALREALATRRPSPDAQHHDVRRRLVTHFAGREATPRTVRELPWQLALLEEWDRLKATISDPPFLVLGWKHCPRDWAAYWRELERRGYDMASAHAPLLTAPLHNPDASRSLVQLLVELGHLEMARPLAADLVAAGGAEPRNLLDSLSLLAGILVDLGALDDALVVLGRLRVEARSAGDSRVLSVCLGNLALCANRLGNPAGALAYHAEDEEHCRVTGDALALGECLGNYAASLMAAGQPSEALERWREQEGIARRWNQISMLCASLEGQARALTDLRRGKQALALLSEAATLRKEAGEARELRFCLLLTALARSSIGDVDGAYLLYKEIEATSAQSGDPEGVVSARLAIARLFLAHGRNVAAQHMVKQAAQAVGELKDPARQLYFKKAIQALADQSGKPGAA